MSLTPEEQAALERMKREMAIPAKPAPPGIRRDRFNGPIGMDENGNLFPTAEEQAQALKKK